MAALTNVRDNAREMAGTWWLLLLWGIVFAFLGALLLASPWVTAAVFMLFATAAWIIASFFTTVLSLFSRDKPGWVQRLIVGVIGLAAGLLLFVNPLFSTVIAVAAQYYLLGFAALVGGVFAIAGAWRSGWSWGGVLLGALQIIIGIILVLHPVEGVAAFLPALGLVALIGGIIMVIAAIRMHFMAPRGPDAARPA